MAMWVKRFAAAIRLPSSRRQGLARACVARARLLKCVKRFRLEAVDSGKTNRCVWITLKADDMIRGGRLCRRACVADHVGVADGQAQRGLDVDPAPCSKAAMRDC